MGLTRTARGPYRPSSQRGRPVAQLAEHRSPKPGAGGSIPSGPANFPNDLAPFASPLTLQLLPFVRLIIYYPKGSRLTELAGVDQSCAVLQAGDKLTLTSPYFPTEFQRTVVLETHGYFVTPSSERSGHGSSSVSRVIAAVERTRPNPFNPTTHLKFTLNVGAIASLGLYSVDGHLVRILHEGPPASGSHEFDWDGRLESGTIAPSGSYFLKLVAGAEVATGKMFLLK